MFAWLRVAVATAAMASWIGATTVPFDALPRAASLEPRKAAFAIWPLVLYPGLLATATLHHDGARALVALPLCVSLQLTYAWAWAIGASASSEGEDDGDEDRRGGRRHLARNGAAIALLGATAFAWRALAHAREWGALAIGAYAGWMALARRAPHARDQVARRARRAVGARGRQRARGRREHVAARADAVRQRPVGRPHAAPLLPLARARGAVRRRRRDRCSRAAVRTRALASDTGTRRQVLPGCVCVSHTDDVRSAVVGTTLVHFGDAEVLTNAVVEGATTQGVCDAGFQK